MIEMKQSTGSFLTYFRKERKIFARYINAHPHFKRNILLDAIFSALVVVLFFGIFNSVGGQARTDQLVRPRAVVQIAARSLLLIWHKE